MYWGGGGGIPREQWNTDQKFLDAIAVRIFCWWGNWGAKKKKFDPEEFVYVVLITTEKRY